MRRIFLSALMAGVASSAVGRRFAHPQGAAPAPYYQPPLAFSWTGFYVGVNGGWGFSDTHKTASETISTAASSAARSATTTSWASS